MALNRLKSGQFNKGKRAPNGANEDWQKTHQTFKREKPRLGLALQLPVVHGGLPY
jgi:hypothetical protein